MAAIKVSAVVKSVNVNLPAELTTSTSTSAGQSTTVASWSSVPTGNLVFASPNGNGGVPTFRNMQVADLPTVTIAKGGTGATDVVNARMNLGLTIGTNVQQWNAGLDALSNLSGSGFVKRSGTSYTVDTNTYLTGNQSISVTGDATGSGTTSIPLTLANSGVTAGTYPKVTVDAKGRVTAGTTLSASDIPSHNHTIAIGNGTAQQMTVDTNQRLDIVPGTNITIAYDDVNNKVTINSTATVAGNTATATALATGRSISMTGDVTYTSDLFTGAANVTGVATLANSGVTAGTYNNDGTTVKPFTVDAKGRITAVGSAVTITPAFSSITAKPTTRDGYGITDVYLKTESDAKYNQLLTGVSAVTNANTLNGNAATNFVVYGQAAFNGTTTQVQVPPMAVATAIMGVNNPASPLPYVISGVTPSLNNGAITDSNPVVFDTVDITGLTGILKYEVMLIPNNTVTDLNHQFSEVIVYCNPNFVDTTRQIKYTVQDKSQHTANPSDLIVSDLKYGEFAMGQISITYDSTTHQMSLQISKMYGGIDSIKYKIVRTSFLI